ncbi:hypothetical protein BJY01DRAFT_209992 [Aspergillus pseudoustus]|uniref:UbiA prenyltransferase family-domain-containing protein n=1 Tax=Aspergillus pseudoustus TaxID=1810923 RepID=A0ABR4KDC9_9EURO
MLFAATLAASALTLTTTFFPNQPATHVPIAIAGSILYPFLKRWTNYALLFLALLYVSTGLNASRTLGFDILSLPPHSSLLHSNLLLNGAIYIANITVETIYMHADVEDDIKSGINSLAVRMYGYSKPVLSLMALAYGALVLSSGFTAGFGVWYFSAAAVSAAILLGIVAKVDLKDGKQCEVYFFGGNAIVMATLAAGLWGEYQYGRVALAASAAAVL